MKTIGDAVMAVFASPADALEAALDMQERIRELDAKLAPRAPVVLKIGVHEGAAIAINASGVLDYFSTTANIAARVAGRERGGRRRHHRRRCATTPRCARGPGAPRAPRKRLPTAPLKGLTGVHRLWRLRPRAEP